MYENHEKNALRYGELGLSQLDPTSESCNDDDQAVALLVLVGVDHPHLKPCDEQWV